MPLTIEIYNKEKKFIKSVQRKKLYFLSVGIHKYYIWVKSYNFLWVKESGKDQNG